MQGVLLYVVRKISRVQMSYPHLVRPKDGDEELIQFKKAFPLLKWHVTGTHSVFFDSQTDDVWRGWKKAWDYQQQRNSMV